MTKTKKLILAGAAVLAWQAGPVLAQTSDTIETFTRADLQAALDANGASYSDNPNNRTIDVQFANGLRANAAVMACDEGEDESNCYATSILATFSPPSGSSEQAIDEAINTYNYRQNFGRAYRDPNGRISVRIYIISDHGIKRRNFAAQIGLWETSLKRFVGYLNPDAVEGD